MPIQPGVTFEDYLTALVDADQFPAARDNKATWRAARLARHLEAGEAFEEQRASGRWYLTHEELLRGGARATVSVDITHRKLEQRRSGQAQKMEALGRIAGGVAHNFNNLLTSILGFAGLARSITKDPDVSRHLSEIQLAGHRGTSLVDELLTYARGEESEKLPTDLQRTIEETTSLIRVAMPTNVHLAIPSGPPLTVTVNRAQLQQALINLCTNARDAIGNRAGKIDVALLPPSQPEGYCTSCQSALPQTDFVQLVVSDNGNGFAPDVLAGAFDPFFTTKPFGEGTGIGLSFVHGIVHEHHGHIVVESIVGRGTTFRLLFPVAVATDHHTEAQSNMLAVSPSTKAR